MTPTVLALVLLAALTHAVWNTWLKLSGDRLAALATIAAGWGLVAICAIPFVGAPNPRAFPFLGASVLLHSAYSLTLIHAYSLGKLSVVYPIARGIAPLIVTFFSVLFLNDALRPAGVLGILCVIAGVVWLGVPRERLDRASVFYAVLTGAFVGCYTLLDGLGARASDAHSFSAWLFLGTSMPLVLIALNVHRGHFLRLTRPLWAKGISAGVISASAFWMIIWALSVAPMGLVAALRESSVVFAALLGALLLRESVRWTAVGLVCLGVVLTRLA